MKADTFNQRYRHVIRWRLWEAMPRRANDPLMAHIQADGWHNTLCGQPIAKMTAMHTTVARAIEAKDCKGCLRVLRSAR